MGDALSEGILQLCGNDPDVGNVIAPRCEQVCSLLNRYIAEIEQYNPALSLVGTNDRNELIVRHILDSLAPLGLIIRLMCRSPSAPQPIIADVGSGAGLPGIPLSIALPQASFSLIERKGRRAHFLRNAQEALCLSNVTVEEAEMEKVKRNRFSLVTFRAFRPLETKIYKKLIRLCNDGGILAAYKGRRSKTEAEMTALEKEMPILCGNWELLPCTVPGLDEERHLLVINNKR